jgi:putative transposase
LLTARRDQQAAIRFFKKAIGWHDLPEKITIDKSGSNLAALESIKDDTQAPFEIRQVKYLNNIVEQDHRTIKRRIQPMMGFKTFRSARRTLKGIELMHMINKGQKKSIEGHSLSAAEQFYSLAA